MKAHAIQKIYLPRVQPIALPSLGKRAKIALAASVPLFAMVAFAGVFAAARSALPGDSLYGFKTDVKESMENIFSVGVKAKASTAKSHALARLDEAERLAMNGALDSTTKEKLMTSFSSDIYSMSYYAAELNQKGGTVAAANILESLNNDLAIRLTALRVHGEKTADLVPVVAAIQDYNRRVDQALLVGGDKQNDVDRVTRLYDGSALALQKDSGATAARAHPVTLVPVSEGE